MSSIIDFFVAPDNDVAAGVSRSALGEAVPSATYGNFDVWSTLEEWESILLNRDLEELITGGGPDIVGGDDSPLVLLVSPDVTKALADADDQTLRETAARWIELRSAEGEVIDDELARELITEIAALSAEAVRTRRSLYCRVY